MQFYLIIFSICSFYYVENMIFRYYEYVYIFASREKMLMRKKLLLAALFAGASFVYSSAQTQLVNGGFENWDGSGNSKEPVQWNSFMSGQCKSGFLFCSSAKNKQVDESTEVRPGSAGTKSVRIWSTNPIGSTIANGNLTTGQIQLGSITPANKDNHNKTVRGNADHRMAIIDRPDSLVFWAKFQPGNNSATNRARVRAVLHDASADYRDPDPDNETAANRIGDATLNYTRTHNGTNYVWQRFSIPFSYTGASTAAPAYILITFTTNENPGQGADNDQVWIDDAELIYVPRTTSVPALASLTYYVTPTTGAAISVPFAKTGIFAKNNIFTAELSDASGSFANAVILDTIHSAIAGTINGTIPAGTPAGTGYRVRVVASNPNTGVTYIENVDDITIGEAGITVSPTALQTIVAGTNGTVLTATEAAPSTSREWKYATVSGGPYSSFSPTETNLTYTPNFATAGTYYVVAEGVFGPTTLTTAEVQINVVQNGITPTTTQVLLVNTDGDTLTVNETPVAASREWLYSTTSGSGYVSFVPVQTDSFYVPNFATSGTYYVVCQSDISGLQVVSNEVTIITGTAGIITGAVSGSPFEFSPSAPDASVAVPFFTIGAFNVGNEFSAELSDASGSFASPTVIGTLAAVGSDTVWATIPATTPAGTGYRIRVVADDPATAGTDNGSDLIVDHFNNSVSPSASQTFAYSASGTPLSVSTSQTAVSEWLYATASGGPYQSFSTSETGTTYTPSGFSIGTYYVVAQSVNQYNDTVTSNEVELVVANGTTITTTAVSGAPFYTSSSSNVQATVDFTSDVIFGSSNTFTAQISDVNGSFSSPTVIGTLVSDTVGTISGTVPNTLAAGNGYRIRVVSSDPVVTGTDNGIDLAVVPFVVSLSDADTQYVAVGGTNATVSIVSTHPNLASVQWKRRTALLGNYHPFNPVVTGDDFTQTFTAPNTTFQIVAEAVNSWDDTLQTEQFVVVVATVNINESENGVVKVYSANEGFVVDLTNSTFQNPDVQFVNMAGQVVYTGKVYGASAHSLQVILASGVYSFRISENGKMVAGKVAVVR